MTSFETTNCYITYPLDVLKIPEKANLAFHITFKDTAPEFIIYNDNDVIYTTANDVYLNLYDCLKYDSTVTIDGLTIVFNEILGNAWEIYPELTQDIQTQVFWVNPMINYYDMKVKDILPSTTSDGTPIIYTMIMSDGAYLSVNGESRLTSITNCLFITNSQDNPTSSSVFDTTFDSTFGNNIQPSDIIYYFRIKQTTCPILQWKNRFGYYSNTRLDDVHKSVTRENSYVDYNSMTGYYTGFDTITSKMFVKECPYINDINVSSLIEFIEYRPPYGTHTRMILQTPVSVDNSTSSITMTLTTNKIN